MGGDLIGIYDIMFINGLSCCQMQYLSTLSHTAGTCLWVVCGDHAFLSNCEIQKNNYWLQV